MRAYGHFSSGSGNFPKLFPTTDATTNATAGLPKSPAVQTARGASTTPPTANPAPLDGTRHRAVRPITSGTDGRRVARSPSYVAGIIDKDLHDRFRARFVSLLPSAAIPLKRPSGAVCPRHRLTLFVSVGPFDDFFPRLFFRPSPLPPPIPAPRPSPPARRLLPPAPDTSAQRATFPTNRARTTETPSSTAAAAAAAHDVSDDVSGGWGQIAAVVVETDKRAHGAAIRLPRSRRRTTIAFKNKLERIRVVSEPPPKRVPIEIQTRHMRRPTVCRTATARSRKWIKSFRFNSIGCAIIDPEKNNKSSFFSTRGR